MRVALIFNTTRPDTTGIYLARACRALGFEADQWELSQAGQIPASYDLYLRIDHGDDYFTPLPAGLRPAVFYAIDTHLPHSWKKIRRVATRFDLVLCCHRDGARRLPGAEWLPVAADIQPRHWPTAFGHGPYGSADAFWGPGCRPHRDGSEGATGSAHGAPQERARSAAPEWEVAFVGTDGGTPRKFYLQALRERYPVSRIGAADYRLIGGIYGRSRIGFNYAIADDVNMRVFEVMAANSLLVTNALSGDDFSRLGFHDRRHLVLYRSPAELFALIDYYLAHDGERRAIAEAGSRLVMERHTYVHRMGQLLECVSRRLALSRPAPTPEAIACASS